MTRFGTPAEVDALIRTEIETLGSGGGTIGMFRRPLAKKVPQGDLRY